jgi:hypothetical protein
MNQAKLEAAQRLNQLQNSMNIINEHVAKLEGTLEFIRGLQAQTATRIAEQRRALAAMPDDEA